MKLSISRLWNPNWTVRFDRKNLESFIFAVLLASRTVLCAKNRDPCKPRSDLTILRTVIRPLLTVPYFPLNLNFKKIKINKTHTHIIYKLIEVDLHYCSFKHAVKCWDLRSHHSFFSFFFSISLTLVLSLSQYYSFSLLSCYFCIFAFSVFLSSLVISCFCLLIYSTWLSRQILVFRLFLEKKKLWIVCASNYLVSLTDFGTRVPAQNSNYSGVFYKRCYRH